MAKPKRSTSKKKTSKTSKKRTTARDVKRPSERAQYPASFIKDAVELCVEIGSIKEVCRMMEIEPRRLRSWLKKAGVDPSAIGSAYTGSNDDDASDQSPATSMHATKDSSPTTPPIGSHELTSDGRYLEVEERKQSLDHLFKVMDTKARTEGLSMSTSALKSLAVGMATVSDKIDLLNRATKDLPPSPTEKGKGVTIPDNVRELVPTKKTSAQ